MSHVVTQGTIEAIHAAVQAAMDGTGRVTAEELAVALAEHEPERYRQGPREMSDSEYEASFASRFGYEVGETVTRTDGDEYDRSFSERFGFEAAL